MATKVSHYTGPKEGGRFLYYFTTMWYDTERKGWYTGIGGTKSVLMTPAEAKERAAELLKDVNNIDTTAGGLLPSPLIKIKRKVRVRQIIEYKEYELR